MKTISEIPVRDRKIIKLKFLGLSLIMVRELSGSIIVDQNEGD